MVWSVLVFDLKTESEWGEPGPPTAVPDIPDKLGPCMCTPRRHRCKFFRADPILRTSDTCFSLTEFRPVPWPDPNDRPTSFQFGAIAWQQGSCVGFQLLSLYGVLSHVGPMLRAGSAGSRGVACTRQGESWWVWLHSRLRSANQQAMERRASRLVGLGPPQHGNGAVAATAANLGRRTGPAGPAGCAASPTGVTLPSWMSAQGVLPSTRVCTPQ